MDILHFLLEKKGYSEEELSKSMGIPIEDLKKILKKKSGLDQKHLYNFSKSENYKIWEIMLGAIPPYHLSKKAKDKLELCKILSDRKKKR